MPYVRLETFILLPIALETADRMPIRNAGALESQFTQYGWEKLDGHTADAITCQAMGLATSPLPEEKDEFLRRLYYQASNYFHPFVHNFWYDGNLVRHYRRRDVDALEVQIKEGDQILAFAAVCDLYHFVPDIAVMALHLKSEQLLELSAAQHVLNRIRRLFPPFLLGDSDKPFCPHFPNIVRLSKEGKSIGQAETKDFQPYIHNGCQPEARCKTDEDIWAPHWRHLLHPLNAEDAGRPRFRARQLGDDRCALTSLISVTDKPAETTLPKWIGRGNTIRLCFADAPGSDELPYSQRYLQSFEETFCYDRFWYQSESESRDAPSLIMNSGYAFTWLGDGNDKWYFADEKCGAPAIFRAIYTPMAIIAHFQKAALLTASRRLAELTSYDKTGVPGPLDEAAFSKLDAQFIAFTQTYWFDEVSPQEQGIELFDMWRRKLRLQPMYDEVRQEIRDIFNAINASHSLKLNKYAAIFAVTSIILAFASYLATFASIADPKQSAFIKMVLDPSLPALLDDPGIQILVRAIVWSLSLMFIAIGIRRVLRFILRQFSCIP